MSNQVTVRADLKVGDVVKVVTPDTYMGDDGTPGVIVAITRKGLATVNFPRVLCNAHTVSDFVFHGWTKQKDEYLVVEGLDLSQLEKLEGGMPEPTIEQLLEQLWPKNGHIAWWTCHGPSFELDKTKPCHHKPCVDGLQEKKTLTNCWGNARLMYTCLSCHKELNGRLADDHPPLKDNLVKR